MVLVTSVRDYINRMLQDISGMKVLILDSETVNLDSRRLRLLIFSDFCISGIVIHNFPRSRKN